MLIELTKARYKGVVMRLDIQEAHVFIEGVESLNEGQGECQEMIALLLEDFKGKEFYSSPPVNPIMEHILDKWGIKYGENIPQNESAK